MTTDPLYSLKEASAKLGAYPNMLRMLIRRNGVPHRLVAGLTVVDDEGIEQLRPLVDAWKSRPRVTHEVTA